MTLQSDGKGKKNVVFEKFKTQSHWSDWFGHNFTRNSLVLMTCKKFDDVEVLLTRTGGGSIVVPARKYPGPSVGALFCCGKLGATEFFGRIQKLMCRGSASPVWHWTCIIMYVRWGDKTTRFKTLLNILRKTMQSTQAVYKVRLAKEGSGLYMSVGSPIGPWWAD